MELHEGNILINNLLRQDLNENLTKNKTELDKTIWEKNLHNFLESFYKLFIISRKHLFQLKKIPGVFQVFLIILSIFQGFPGKISKATSFPGSI